MPANQSPNPDKDPKVLAGVNPEAAARVNGAVDGLMARGKDLPDKGSYKSAVVKEQPLTTWVAHQIIEDGAEVLSMHRRDDHYMFSGEPIPHSSDVWKWEIIRHPGEDGNPGIVTFKNSFYSIGSSPRESWYRMQQDAIPHDVDVDPTTGEYREVIIEHKPFDQRLNDDLGAPTSPLPTMAYPDVMVQKFTTAMNNLYLPGQSQ